MTVRVVPMLRVPDVHETATWYESIGIVTQGTQAEKGCPMDWASLRYRNTELMLSAGATCSQISRREVDLNGFWITFGRMLKRDKPNSETRKAHVSGEGKAMRLEKRTSKVLELAVISFVLLASDWAFSQSLADPQTLKGKTNERDGAAAILIKGGEFEMGSNAEELKLTWARLGWDLAELEFTKSEQPKHRVKVDNFWIYRDLVTVSQYRKYCQATSTTMPTEPSYSWKDNSPIVNVSWHDAKAYCQWAGCRLPFEAEWEYAARGRNTGLDESKRTVFIWGDHVPDSPVANLADETFLKSGYYDSPNFQIFRSYDDGYATASPVDAFAPNSVGLRDMAGNVLEWCEDWFDSSYYSVSPSDNPHGPTTGTKRVLRGGAFDTIPTITRIARRLSNDPDIRNEEKGFRCVLSN